MSDPDRAVRKSDGESSSESALSGSDEGVIAQPAPRGCHLASSVRQFVGEVRAAFDADRFLLMVTAAGLATAAGCSVVIAKLVDDVLGADDTARRDPRVLDWAIEHRTDALTTLFRTVTHLADPIVVIVVTVAVALLLIRFHHRRLAFLVAASTIGTAMVTTAAKSAVDRARPPEMLWLGAATGPAFPSGHAAQSVALYGALAVVLWKLLRPVSARIAVLVVAGIVVIAVGVSRVYLAVHWPSDVVCGWAVATLWLTTLLLIGWSLPRLRDRWAWTPSDRRWARRSE